MYLYWLTHKPENDGILRDQMVQHGFLIKKKKKKYLIKHFFIIKNDLCITNKLILQILIRIFSKKLKKFKKHKKQIYTKKNFIINFFKFYIYMCVYLFKFNKNYKINKKLNKLVYKPNFLILKNKKIQMKFPTLKKVLFKKKNKKLSSKRLHVYIHFFFNTALLLLNFKKNKTSNFKKNKISIYSNLLITFLLKLNFLYFFN